MIKGNGSFLSAFAGGLALLAAGTPALAQTTGKISDARVRIETLRAETPHRKVMPEIIVTETHIAILKNVLNLRPDQEPYWIPVAAALGELARGQAKSADGDMTERHRKPATVGAKQHLKRIAAISAPLIRALDESQKRDVITLARAFGLERLVASF
jgi:hypothetical protein